MRDISFRSKGEKAGSLNPFSSTFQLQVDVKKFSNTSRFIQLQSFLHRDGSGPTWSRVVEVIPQLYATESDTMPSTNITQDNYLYDNLSERQETEYRRNVLNQNDNPSHLSFSAAEQKFQACRKISHTFSESQLSSAMFWDQLLGIAQLLVPTASELISGAINQNLTGASSDTTSPAITVSPTLVQQIIETLIQASSQPENSTSAAQSFSFGNNFYRSLNTSHSSKSSSNLSAINYPKQFNQFSHAQIVDGGVISGPLLMGLISSLGPSVIQALGPIFENSPQLLETILDSPLRLLNAVNEAKLEEKRIANQRIQEMLNQGNQALLLHMLNRNPGSARINSHNPVAVSVGETANNTITSVASSLSQQSEQIPWAQNTPTSLTNRKSRRSLILSNLNSQEPNHRINENLNIKFEWPTLQNVNNKPKAVFSVENAITLKVLIEQKNNQIQPLIIPKMKIKLRILDLVESKVLAIETIQRIDLSTKEPLIIPLSKSNIALLPLHSDLIVTLDIRWVDQNGEVNSATNRATQTLYLVGQYVLGNIGQLTDAEFSLNQPNQYRAFWHRVWEGGSSSHNRWYFKMNARYYYRLAIGEMSNGRSETKIKLDDELSQETKSRKTWDGMLKSGMELAASELNKLIPHMGGDYPVWTAEQLATLNSFDFESRLNQQSTVKIELRGRSEERGALWVFPVMQMIDIELKQVNQVAENGAVISMDSSQHKFPVPTAAVFVGTELES